MKVKRLLTLAAALALAIACVAAMSSCDFAGTLDGLMHEHDYRLIETTATCTDTGTATYECDCGHTYSETMEATGHSLVTHPAVAPTCTEDGSAEYATCSVCSYTTFTTVSKLGHDYDEHITRYPTTSTTGVKKLVCSRCNDTKTEDIEAVSFSLPSVADFIAAALEDGTYSIKADEDTQIIMVKELDDYTYSSDAYKTFLAFRLAEAELTVNGALINGFIKLEMGLSSVALNADLSADEAEKPDFEDILTLELFLNGDSVSVTACENEYVVTDEEYDLREVFYTAVAASLGITYDELVEAGYIIDKATGYLPIIGKLLENLGSIEIPEANAKLPEILAVIGGSLVSITELEGDTVYTFDTDALAELVELYENKTVAEILDAQYGEGTAEALSSMLVALPDMTVKQIADYAIAIAESCELSINDVYAFVSMLIYQATDITVDIEEIITDRYSKTVTEVLVEIMKQSNPELDEAAAVSNIKNGITGTVTAVMASDIDGLYHLACCGAADHGADTCAIASESLKAILALAENTTTVSVTVNADGIITDFELGFTDPTDNESIINVSYADANGEQTVTVTADAYQAVMVVKDGLATIVVKEDDTVIIDGSVEYTDATADLELFFVVDENETATLTFGYTAAALEAKVTSFVGGTAYDLFVLTAEFDGNGNVTAADLAVRELFYTTYLSEDETEETIVSTECEPILSAQFEAVTNEASETAVSFKMQGYMGTIDRVGNDVLVLTATIDANGTVTSANLDVYDLYYEDTTDPEEATGDTEKVLVQEKIIDADYTNVDSVVDLVVIADDITSALHSEEDLLYIYALKGDDEYIVRINYQVADGVTTFAADINFFKPQYEEKYDETLEEYVDVYVGDVLTDLFDVYYAEATAVSTLEIRIDGKTAFFTLRDAAEDSVNVEISISEGDDLLCEGNAVVTPITRPVTDAETGETANVFVGFTVTSDLICYDTYIDENGQTVTNEIDLRINAAVNDRGYQLAVFNGSNRIFATMLVITDGVITRYLSEVNDPADDFNSIFAIEYNNNLTDKISFVLETNDGAKLEQIFTYGDDFVTYDYLHVLDGKVMTDYTVTVTGASTDTAYAVVIDFDFDKYVLEIGDVFDYVDVEDLEAILPPEDVELEDGMVPVYPLPDGDYEYVYLPVATAIKYFIANGRITLTYEPVEVENN